LIRDSAGNLAEGGSGYHKKEYRECDFHGDCARFTENRSIPWTNIRAVKSFSYIVFLVD
jgi:hypothetical protein